MTKGYENEKMNCYFTENYIQIITIAAFLIGFIFFRFILNKNSIVVETDEIKELQIKKAKEYLDQYQQENEDFFFQNSPTDCE